MNPCNFFLVLQIKNTLKGKRFEDVKMNRFNVIQQLFKTPITEYRRCIQQQVEQPLEKVWRSRNLAILVGTSRFREKSAQINCKLDNPCTNNHEYTWLKLKTKP